jgi:RNase P subunit RPR2
VRVLLGRPPDPLHPHRTSCEDCDREVWLGDRQRALQARQEDDVVVRCVNCSDSLGVLRVLRPKPRR